MRSEKVRITNKVIFLILLLDQLYHVLCIILAITHLPIIVVCTLKPYMIQYPISHPNYGKLQIPMAYNNNLVKNNVCTTIQQGGGTNEQNSKGMQLRWCPSGLSRTQKKRNYNGCESKDQWSNLQWSHRQGQQLSRYGDQNKLFHEFIASS
jgi:hypothetical protein